MGTSSARIKDSKDSEIGKAIDYATSLIGIEAVVNKEKARTMLEFIKSNYGEVEIDQFKKAFEYVAVGKLGIDNQQHYNNFSPMYVARVLNAFLGIKWGDNADRLANPSKYGIEVVTSKKMFPDA